MCGGYTRTRMHKCVEDTHVLGCTRTVDTRTYKEGLNIGGLHRVTPSTMHDAYQVRLICAHLRRAAFTQPRSIMLRLAPGRWAIGCFNALLERNRLACLGYTCVWRVRVRVKGPTKDMPVLSAARQRGSHMCVCTPHNTV
eukprot:356861-Chlamydomonas_euryale.AAC.20